LRNYLIIFMIIVFSQACKNDNQNVLFEQLSAEDTGIDFQNTVKNTEDFNIFSYRNFYNGGGVATGDINNDGLPDVLFTANMGSNKLYLNKGNFKFEDISEKAGITQKGQWNTGVVMVDINNDGWLDIYICNAGYDKWKSGKGNALFINNHDLTFTEKATEYGLDEKGYTTHAAFLDYDMDGDLDAYILNNSFIPVNTLNYDNNRELRAKDWPVKDYLKGGGDKLLRNDNGKFVDVSEEAGIYGSLIGFGLGVTVGDVNNDNYPDIYISNDFFEKDYLYINQKNGKFREEIEQRIPHTSMASMGADMADINNDGYEEIFVTDMLPIDEHRLKSTTSFENHYIFNLKNKKGFYNQYMQNSLQLNNHDGTFCEIGFYAGVAASDWSWGALMFDADNDSKTDIYVSNGIYHDVIDQDFIDFFANEINQKMVLSGEKEKFDNIIKHMPSKPIGNNFFLNKGSFRFEEKSAESGLSTPSFSNGASYADLDNDGDLDLVVNNVNQPCFVYKNNTEKLKPENHYLKLKFKGSSSNVNAIGTKVQVFAGDQVLTRQLNPSRGFQSSTEYAMVFGMGPVKQVDSVRIIWPDLTYQVHKSVKTDSTYSYSMQGSKPWINTIPQAFFKSVFAEVSDFPFEKHLENDYEDYYNEKNIPVLLSREGPKVAVGDVNGDKKEDIYIGGGAGQAGQLYLQTGAGFRKTVQPAFEQYAIFEDTAVHFFDADGDGDLDLYAGSGGNEYDPGERLLMDRIYFNDGQGNFKINGKALPLNGMNTGVIISYDFDGDGDLDLFVGGRSYPRQYGLKPISYIYQNDGKGIFKDVTQQVNPDIRKIGMVRAANWADLNGDGKRELIIAGDWMSPKVYEFKGGKFVPLKTSLDNLSGFWGALQIADLDKDGDLDMVLGNMGENFPLSVDLERPAKIWVGDFDNNSFTDKIMTKTYKGKDVPVFLKREMTEQFPFLKNKNLKHSEYADKTLEDLFEPKVLKQASVSSVNFMKSVIAINDGKGNFTFSDLPVEVQFSCVNAILADDVNADGLPDLILGGNNTGFIPQLSRQDASRGIVLINKGKGKFAYLPNKDSGFTMTGEIRDLATVTVNKQKYFLSLINDQKPRVFKINR